MIKPDLENRNEVDEARLALDLCRDDGPKLEAWARKFGREACEALARLIDDCENAEEIDDLRSELRGADEKIDELNDEIEELRADLSRLEKEVERLESEKAA